MDTKKIIIISLVVIAIGVGGYFYWKSTKSTDDIVSGSSGSSGSGSSSSNSSGSSSSGGSNTGIAGGIDKNKLASIGSSIFTKKS